MGHRHLPDLPKSERWTQIVGRLATFDDQSDAAEIARETVEAARRGFERLATDKGLAAAFSLLASVAAAAKTTDPAATLLRQGIVVDARLSPLSLARALRATMPEAAAPEQAALVERAASEAIGVWHRTRMQAEEGPRLFAMTPDPVAPWRDASNGAGFCEVSRLFFGRLTERFLGYYLDRAASRQMSDLWQRAEFDRALSSHVETISRHAFETAKITQSYAAGWFNKHAVEGRPPSAGAVRGFVAHAMSKLREELRREVER